MRTVKTIIISSLIIMTIASSISGCNFHMGTPGPYIGDETALFTLATFSIPECDQIGTKIEIIETDAQGRTLFKIRMGNSPMYFCCFGEESPLLAFAVCQHCDDEKVYYYEDECWVICKDAADLTEAEKEQLKERNDWDLPLNYDKMTEKPIIPKDSEGRKNYENGWKIEQDAKEKFLKKVSLEEGEYAFVTLLDDDGEGRILFTVIVERFNDDVVDASSVRSYLEMIDTNKRINNVVIEEIRDPAHVWEQIKEFKAQSKWKDRD